MAFLVLCAMVAVAGPLAEGLGIGDLERDALLQITQPLVDFSRGLVDQDRAQQERDVASAMGGGAAGGRSGPCNCENKQCECCMSLALPGLPNSGGADNKPCFSVGYDEEAMNMKISAKVGDKVMFEKAISAENPPPACFKPPQAPMVQVCLRLQDIKFGKDQNAQVCVQVEGGMANKDPAMKLPLGCVVADKETKKLSFQKNAQATPDGAHAAGAGRSAGRGRRRH